MPLDLINIGAEANDGTGDTPRAAGVKMNAAIAVVNTLSDAPAPVDYSGAIAAIETTQGTQAGAIASLALDVDALETSQAGQDSAIAALIADVAALEAAPPSASGWDYIGPTEPVSPSVSFRWLETPAQKGWYWTGSVWVSTETTPIPFNGAIGNSAVNFASATGNRFAQIPFRRALAVSILWAPIISSVDANNRWDFSFGFGPLQFGTPTAIVGTASLTEPNTRDQVFTPLSGISNGGNEICFYASFVKVLNAGALTWGGSALVREVRV